MESIEVGEEVKRRRGEQWEGIERCGSNVLAWLKRG